MRFRAVMGVFLLAIAARTTAQGPPRDIRRPVEAGTARIIGTVRSADAQSRPLRRARVLLNGDALPVGRTAIADDTGSFTFDGLPAGLYTLSATKEAYVTAAFGARRPQRPGHSIALRNGETRRIGLRLPRGAVITGTVLDQEGQPAPAVTVIALTTRYVPAAGERRLVNAGTAVTDDRGIYRLFGLAAGDYVMSAAPRGQTDPYLQVLPESEVRRALAAVTGGDAWRSRPGIASPTASALPPPEPRRTIALAPVYYPGTTFASRAQPVQIAAAEERFGIDFQLDYVPTVAVSGMVSEPADVSLTPSPQAGPITIGRSTRAGADGRFFIPAVPPGEYALVARAFPSTPSAQTGSPALAKAAQTDIVVNGEEMAGVSLALQPGVTIRGRLVFDGESAAPPDYPGLRLPLPGSLATGVMMISLPPLQLEGDRRFTVSGVIPGTYRIGSNAQALRTSLAGWWLKSVTSGGAELLDALLELHEDREDLVVTFADRASELTGIVRDGSGNPWADGFVVVFSTDRARWFFNSRRVAGARPNSEGRYQVRNLPPGEYFIVAYDDVDVMEWFDPALLAQLAPRAARIRIGEYEKKTYDMMVR